MKEVLNQEGIAEALQQIAEQLKPVITGKKVAFIGLLRRGDIVAERLVTLLAEDDTVEFFLGSIDVSLYRDDLNQLEKAPQLLGSHIDFALDDVHLILVDDVLFSGRTIRAALDAITDYGRPQKIELAVLIDRGHRELPIAPDYVGLTLETAKEDRVIVNLDRSEDHESVELHSNHSL